MQASAPGERPHELPAVVHHVQISDQGVGPDAVPLLGYDRPVFDPVFHVVPAVAVPERRQLDAGGAVAEADELERPAPLLLGLELPPLGAPVVGVPLPLASGCEQGGGRQNSRDKRLHRFPRSR